MRLIRTLSILLVAAGSLSTEAKSKTIVLTGSWKETNRFTTEKTAIAFTDTVRIDFLIGNEYVWQKDMGYANRGTYKANEKELDLGARYFTVVEMKPNRMLVKNDQGLYEFSRYVKPPVVTDNSQAGSTQRAPNEVAAPGTVREAELSGKWQTFKRTSAVQQEKIDYTRLIKSIDISLSGGRMTGAAYAAQRLPDTGAWTIDRYEQGTIYCTGTDKRTFKVLQCADGELVLQEGNITYFFKEFR